MSNRPGRTGQLSPGLVLLFSALFFLFAPVKMWSQKREEKPPVCKLQVNQKSFELKPNAGGFYQRIPGVKTWSSVPFEIAYPTGKPGEPVVLTVLDGGRINGDKVVEVVKLNNDLKCVFNLKLNNNLGLFRVLVVKGYDEKVVQVWVGDEPQTVKQ
jgi:hypothetical protein